MDGVSVTAFNAPYVWEITILKDNAFSLAAAFDVELFTPIDDNPETMMMGAYFHISKDDLN